MNENSKMTPQRKKKTTEFSIIW